MIKRRTKQIIAVAGLTAVAGTTIPVGVVFGLQQSAKTTPSSASDPIVPQNPADTSAAQTPDDSGSDGQGGVLTPDGNSLPPEGVSTKPADQPSTGTSASNPGAGTAENTSGANPSSGSVTTGGSSTSTGTSGQTSTTAPAATKPNDEVSSSVTPVDNTDPYYVLDGSLPTLAVVEPTPQPGYAPTGGYVWKDANGAMLDGTAFVALADGASFSAVWTLEASSGSGLPYTYTQRFVVKKLVYDIPDNQTSVSVTNVDNAVRSTLPSDLLAAPSPAEGYVFDGAVVWRDAAGSILSDQAFASLPDKTSFSAVWTLKRADRRVGTYTYTQRFKVALPAITNPGSQQSVEVTSVNNLGRHGLPTDLLVQPAAADGYQLQGEVVWKKADGSALTGDAFTAMDDRATFTAVRTLVRTDGTPNDSYQYSQRFVVAQPPLVPVANKTSDDVTNVDNFGATVLPTNLLAPALVADGYVADGTYQWVNSAGTSLSLQDYLALKDGTSFSAVWKYKRMDGRTGTYTYTQRFAVKLTVYANESSATAIEVDNITNPALPNEQRADPTPKPGYYIAGSPVWQVRGALLTGKTYATLPTSTDFGAVWTLRRTDGQSGSYTYTQRFVTNNAGPATTVYPNAYPVLTNTTLLFYGISTALPNVLAPVQQPEYKPWSAPVFTNEATGEVVTNETFATLPAGTKLLATLTAAPGEGNRGQSASYKIRYVIQKSSVSVNSADLSSYGYGLFSGSDPVKALTVLPAAIKPQKLNGYNDWNAAPVLQVKVNPAIVAQYPTGWMTLGDGTNNTIRPADFAASVTAQLTKAYGIEYTDAATGSLAYTYEYRYVWTATIDDNHTGVQAVNFVQNFFLSNHARLQAITSSPVYDVSNTGFSSDAKFQLVFDGTPVSVTIANLAEAINYKYPDTVDTSSAASPTALPLILPEATKALNGETVPTTYGDYYTSQKTNPVVNPNYFVRSQAASMILTNPEYAAGMSDSFDLSSFIGRHIAYSSRPLISVSYTSAYPESLVALANSLKFTDTWFYAGYYYYPEDYANEQFSMDEIQKMLYNWQPSYRDIPWSSTPDYQMIDRVGNMHDSVLSGYDASGKPVYTDAGNKGAPAIPGQAFFGDMAGKVGMDSLTTGYFKRIYSSPNFYTYARDPGAETKFNVGSFTYVKDQTLHSFLFAYFDNLPLSNVPAKLGFTYMINGTTLAI